MRIKSFHQEHRATALDFASDFTMEVRRHTGDAAGKNLAALGHEFFQEIGIFVIDSFNRDVDTAPGHGAIGTAKSGTAVGGRGVLWELPSFAIERVRSQKRSVILFL